MPPSLEIIETVLKKAFPDATIKLQDYKHDGVHILVEITSKKFVGLKLLEQHRLVYQTLEKYLQDGSVHALKLKTLTPSV